MYQVSSHNFLSVIFGILGKFGIEIGTRKNVGRKKFRRKKPENFWSKKIGDQKKYDFCSKKSSLKKSIKIQNFEISIFFGIFLKFQNFEFS